MIDTLRRILYHRILDVVGSQFVINRVEWMTSILARSRSRSSIVSQLDERKHSLTIKANGAAVESIEEE